MCRWCPAFHFSRRSGGTNRYFAHTVPGTVHPETGGLPFLVAASIKDVSSILSL